MIYSHVDASDATGYSVALDNHDWRLHDDYNYRIYEDNFESIMYIYSVWVLVGSC